MTGSHSGFHQITMKCFLMEGGSQIPLESPNWGLRLWLCRVKRFRASACPGETHSGGGLPQEGDHLPHCPVSLFAFPSMRETCKSLAVFCNQVFLVPFQQDVILIAVTLVFADGLEFKTYPHIGTHGLGPGHGIVLPIVKNLLGLWLIEHCISTSILLQL